MKENKNSCPVCFTKMRVQGDGLVCPECGYKLCDHKYKGQDLYNTNHTHTPNYTTAYPAARNNPAPANNTSANRPNNPPIPTDAELRTKKVMKLVRIVVIVYVVFIILSVFGSFFTEILTHLLF